MEQAVKELIEISQYSGNRVDYTQGGGGNTSVKIDNQHMIIKASGFKLKDINENQGFVKLNYSLIQSFINDIQDVNHPDLEIQNKNILKQAVIPTKDQETLRPSVEAGFHAILDKYVIHTHAVYANLINCAKNGSEYLKTIFSHHDFSYIMIPYVDPGLTLSITIHHEIKKYVEIYDEKPEVIFLVNHGLIVTSNDLKRAMYLHTLVNEKIRLFFKIDDIEKQATIRQLNETLYQSTMPFINHHLAYIKQPSEQLATYPLFPDQLIFLNNVIDADLNKMVVSTNEVKFATNRIEAEIMNEALFSFLFIVSILSKNNIEISVMDEKEIAFINGWEAEKYRKKLAEKGLNNEKNQSSSPIREK